MMGKYGLINNIIYIIKHTLIVQKSVILLGIFSGIVSTMFSLLKLFTLPIILNVFEGETNHHRLIAIVSTLIISTMFCDSLQTYIKANEIFGRIELRSYFTFKIHDKLATTSYPNTETPDFLEKLNLANKAVNGNEGAISSIWDTFEHIFKYIVCFAVYAMLLLNLDMWVLSLTIVISLIGYILTKKCDIWVFKHRSEGAKYLRKLNYLNDKIQGMTMAKEILIFNMKQWMLNIYNDDLILYKKYIEQKEIKYAKSDIIKLFLSVLRNLIVYIYIIDLLINEKMPVSYFLLYFNAINGFDSWIEGILSEISIMARQGVDIAHMREFLDYEEKFLFEEGEHIKRLNAYDIELRNVSYTYPKSNKICINKINLKIKQGEKIAIVGLNGAGKTTLIKLICGFVKPDSGEILLNGKNIDIYNKTDYYSLFSAVFQNFSILAGTVANNVAQTMENIDYEKMKKCLKQSGLYEKIESLPDKYNTHMGKEVYDDAIEFSGGETQKLLLSRALYKDAPIFILDEPTAAMDPIAEKLIYEQYDQLTKGKSVVFISHRLASTRFCDRIILISDGSIIEEGTHDELLKNQGKYYELFNIQSQYYQENNMK